MARSETIIGTFSFTSPTKLFFVVVNPSHLSAISEFKIEYRQNSTLLPLILDQTSIAVVKKSTVFGRIPN
jgi:hypothetical protein